MKLVESAASSANTSSSGKRTASFPLLVIVSAVPIGPATSSSSSSSDTLEWIATVNLDRVDVTPQKIVGYLNNVLDVHKSHFIAKPSTIELLEGGEGGGDQSKPPYTVEEELEIYQA
jgi:hypothetical protein